MTKNPIAMPAEPSERAWQFLARVARDRREFIGLSQEELAEFGGPGKSTVGKVERAAQKGYPQRTQQQLEKALGWSRGAVREILHLADADYFEDQGEAIAADYIEAELPDLTKTNNPIRTAANLSDDELLAELTYRMKRYALQEGGTGHVADPDQKTSGRGRGPHLDIVGGAGVEDLTATNTQATPESEPARGPRPDH